MIIVSSSLAAETFRFANYYGDHMVLQRGDKMMSVVWGYIPQCDTITAEMNGASTSGTCTTESGINGSNSITIIVTVRIINVESDAAPTVSWWSTHHYCV